MVLLQPLNCTIEQSETRYEIKSDGCVSLGGYSAHAATAVKAHERERLEKLVRYMARRPRRDPHWQMNAFQSFLKTRSHCVLKPHGRTERTHWS